MNVNVTFNLTEVVTAAKSKEHLDWMLEASEKFLRKLRVPSSEGSHISVVVPASKPPLTPDQAKERKEKKKEHNEKMQAQVRAASLAKKARKEAHHKLVQEQQKQAAAKRAEARKAQHEKREQAAVAKKAKRDVDETSVPNLRKEIIKAQNDLTMSLVDLEVLGKKSIDVRRAIEDRLAHLEAHPHPDMRMPLAKLGRALVVPAKEPKYVEKWAEWYEMQTEAASPVEEFFERLCVVQEHEVKLFRAASKLKAKMPPNKVLIFSAPRTKSIRGRQGQGDLVF